MHTQTRRSIQCAFTEQNALLTEIVRVFPHVHREERSQVFVRQWSVRIHSFEDAQIAFLRLHQPDPARPEEAISRGGKLTKI